MILNALSISILFISILSIALSTWGVISCISLYNKWGNFFTSEQKTILEDRSYLVLLILVVVLMIRLFSWPLFYATLHSFIPDIEGAMCIFGVTKVLPGLTSFLEILKPINFFLIGGWLLLHALDRSVKTSPLMERKFLFLFVVGLFVIFDSLGDILLITRITPGALVSCCTTVTDVSSRLTRSSSELILGSEFMKHLRIIFFISHLFLIASTGLILKFNIFRRPVLLVLFLLSILNAVIFIYSQIEVFAPAMMHLPFHHCLYCLWQYVPDSILVFAFFTLGTFSIGWGFTTELWGNHDDTADLLPAFLRKIYWFAFFFLTASLIMLTVHVLVD